MKKIFNKSDICRDLVGHINCDDETVENTILNLLSEQYPSKSKISVNFITDDIIEVNIDD